MESHSIAGRSHWAIPCARCCASALRTVLIAVLVPVVALASQGELRNFNTSGTVIATVAGALGALGAVCIIYSFRAGASPLYVMPLVFGGAPLVNVLTTMVLDPPKTAPNPLLYVGFVIAAVGAAMVLYFRPH